MSITGILPEVRAETKLSNEERASIIAGSAMKAELVRGAPDATEIAITEALAQTTHLQKIDDKEVLEAVGGVLNEALSEEPAADERGTFEVRGEPSTFETRSWIGNKVKEVITAIDKLVGKLIEDRLGVLNQRLRNSLMNGVADTLGDIVAYHSNKEAIQKRLWDAIDDQARGYGTDTNPIGIIAHSLGGVISFDAMVAPANGKALCVDSFVTFGSQPAFFEIIDPRRPNVTYSSGHPIELPVAIKKWFNLWDVVDILAFTAGTVFKFKDGSKPEDIPVEDPISVMLDEKLWLHSVYWGTPQLLSVLTKAFK